MKFINRCIKEFNKVPELAFKEFKTQAFILDTLKSMGFIPNIIANTGVILYIKGRNNKTICLRSDMDALKIDEKSNKHMCGHDAHMTMLLSIANRFKENVPNNNLVLLFQPAEETISGASFIESNNLLKNYYIDEMYALHLHPFLTKNELFSKNGCIMSGSIELDIFIQGFSSHVSNKDKGIDSILALSYLLPKLNNINDFINGDFIFHIGCINAGTMRNQVSDNSLINISFRYFNKVVLSKVLSYVHSLLNDVDNLYFTNSKYSILNNYPPLINSDNLFNKHKEGLNELKKPLLTAEDFSFYKCQKLFTFLGVNEIDNKPLHNKGFYYDKKVLLKGIDFYLSVIK